MGPDWQADFERERGRYEDGAGRLSGLGNPDDRQRQLTRMGNAATGAGLALLMAGRREEAVHWLARSAERYRESFAGAPPESWGRPIGALKARVLAGDWGGAAAEAGWALGLGAPDAMSPIGRYAGCLALLVLGRDAEAVQLADGLLGCDDFPGDVAGALAALGRADGAAYGAGAASVLRSFETREAYLEDVPVADTVVVLQALAERRGLAVELESSLLP